MEVAQGAKRGSVEHQTWTTAGRGPEKHPQTHIAIMGSRHVYGPQQEQLFRVENTVSNVDMPENSWIQKDNPIVGKVDLSNAASFWHSA